MTEITVTIWHNVRADTHGRHLAMLDGYAPGDPMVRVFTYQTLPGSRTPEEIADHAFAVFNGHPFDDEGERLAGQYYGRRLRSISKGDIVSAGEIALAVAGAGWTPVRGGLTEVRTDEHGTHPLPPVSPCKERAHE
jgi:hypothetical protein